jgi:hypothetical protein
MAVTVMLIACGLTVASAAPASAPDSGSVGSPAGSHTVHAGPLALTLPADWQWRILRGVYRDCTTPAIDLALASYRRPALFVRQGGSPVVVPSNQLQLAIGFGPIKTSATPWKDWRLSNRLLKPWHPVDQADPNRFRAETVLPRSAAITAVAFFGSIPMPSAVLAQANRVLRSIQVDRHYSCR